MTALRAELTGPWQPGLWVEYQWAGPGELSQQGEWQVLIRSSRVPIVPLECVSCKAQAVYAVSRSSYVYLEGRCTNCRGDFKQGYEQALAAAAELDPRQQLRAQIHKNVTETLVSLRVNTGRNPADRGHTGPVHGIQPRARVPLVFEEDTAQAGSHDARRAGGLIDLTSSDMEGPQPSELGAMPPALMVASRAYHLSSALMRILMRSRVLDEEPLTLGAASGPGCHFSIPTAFSGALSNLTDVVQLIFLVHSNPFPFGYIGNYTVSTKVVSMAFQTQAGAQIPIGQLASERAITVKVPSSSDQVAQGPRVPSSSIVIPPRPRVCQLPGAGESPHTCTPGCNLPEEPEPYLAAYLHSVPLPNEHNCSASRKISLEALAGGDHRLYTFFMAPGTREPGGTYYLNLTSHFHWLALEVSVGLYASLCQYFSEAEMT
ncbi:Polycystin-1 [Manis javanica]|nr:Polycystin-1 [Manis javanica]